MSNKRPVIEMSSTEEDYSSSTEEEIYFSPIKKPRLSKKCEDKDCYFCNIIKKDCSNEDITIFKKT